MTALIIKTLFIFLALVFSAALTAFFGFIAELSSVRVRKETEAPLNGENSPSELFRAIVLCDTVPPGIPLSFENQGYTDCGHANRTFEGFTACPKACLGLGSCVVVCPSNAIRIGDGHISISDACIGCGNCVKACPRSLIHLLPLEQRGSLKCAGVTIPGTADICTTGKNGHMLDYREFPDSFFKNLDTWGIIRKKSRFE